MVNLALNKYFDYKYGDLHTEEASNVVLEYEDNDTDTDSIEIKSSEKITGIDLSDIYVPKKINLTIPKRKIVKARHIVNTHKTKKRYRCDGRTWCSQMTSCEEATFFSHHCSSTMDGDGDGIPCESQWCGH